MSKKIVIAHRGASGYLPEHSMEAKAMAHAMNADFIEQDIVMSKDDQLLVLHDHFLDTVTNVATVFPDRARQDGRFYAIDFTLSEIQSLQMTEAFITQEKAVYPARFPLWKSDFKVHTFTQEIELIQGLNKSRGRNIGIYPEIKAPAFHRSEGKDISLAVIQTLKHYGYHQKSDAIFLQCFDPHELLRIKNELFIALDINLKLVQLIAETAWFETGHYIGGKKINYQYDWMYEMGAMQKISEYADAIGPWFPRIVDSRSTQQQLIFTQLVEQAHQYNLLVHPYTFRRDKGEIPDYANSFNDLLNIFYIKADVDGLFTDFPDLAVQFLQGQ
ncbi:glycerophosphodiester phosphodiesterase [Psychromonas sp. psych-6C06]|uniref:glycerophosphodiester phosphodiesterase n=1 Tax=Psychromonas sp. psych-6C06 TaxID=2058089 RepID=UPI000C32860B|nr:glycerophosphodiester phosphodiesterase [Psychromonas sp. psych-6C06]PKF61950.1 glycerophosphodiester phosphodiesterase [Psychromonas sp. psych-6C06]